MKPLQQFMVENCVSEHIKERLKLQMDVAYQLSLTDDETNATNFFSQYSFDESHPIHNKDSIRSVVDLNTLAQEFSKCKKPIFIYYPKLMAFGFFNEECKTCFVCRIGNLKRILKIDSENEYKKLVDSSLDSHIGKFFKTTSKHSLGRGFVGIVEFNEPQLSTVLGGELNPIKPNCPRYVIRWVKWAKQQRHLEAVGDIDQMIEMGTIEEADPDEKQNLNRPEKFVEYPQMIKRKTEIEKANTEAKI